MLEKCLHKFVKNGKDRHGKQRWRCTICETTIVPLTKDEKEKLSNVALVLHLLLLGFDPNEIAIALCEEKAEILGWRNKFLPKLSIVSIGKPQLKLESAIIDLKRIQEGRRLLSLHLKKTPLKKVPKRTHK